MAVSKRMRAINAAVDATKYYPITDAVNLLKSVSKVKFRESVDVVVALGIDARKSEQLIRGATQLPHGSGRVLRVAVFAQGAAAEAAKAAGAERVGFEDLAAYIKEMADQGGKFDFDILIATPDAMRLIGPLGRVLGPKGLMPNPKVGTVTTDVVKAVQNAKSGQISYRTDKGGLIHCTIGKIDFEPKALEENLSALISDLRRAKPSTSKGIFLKKITVTTTMGPGVMVELSSVAGALS